MTSSGRLREKQSFTHSPGDEPPTRFTRLRMQHPLVWQPQRMPRASSPRIALPTELSSRPFSVAEARALGMTENRLRGNDLQRPYWGARNVTLPQTVLERARSYAVRMPTHAFFSAVTAASLFGAPVPEHLGRGPLHVAVPSPSRAPRARGIIGHRRQICPEHVVTQSGLPTSSPEFLMTELAPVLRLEDLVAVGDYFVHWRNPLTSIARLDEAACRFPFRRGRPRLREAVALLDAHAESPQESRLRVILFQGGITYFTSNLPVTTSSGDHYRADFGCLELKVILEYQGAHHLDPNVYRADLTRRSRLEADGWHVMLLAADDLRDPGELCARVRRLTALARSRRPTRKT